MTDEQAASVAVARSRVFVTTDGLFVVHWEPHQVQDLLTGRYLPFRQDRFGSPISDYELSQLCSRNVVARFDDQNVYLMSAFENWATPSVQRAYYLYTHISKERIRDIEALMVEHGLSERYAMRAREQFIAVRGGKGIAFEGPESAEQARADLSKRLPDIFGDCAVAFVDIVTSN